MNCDGTANLSDINPFILALSSPAQYQAAYPNCNILNGDINGDGTTNNDDLNPFVALLEDGGIGGLLAMDAPGDPNDSNDNLNYLYLCDANGNFGQLIDWAHDPNDPAGAIVARSAAAQAGRYAYTPTARDRSPALARVYRGGSVTPGGPRRGAGTRQSHAGARPRDRRAARGIRAGRGHQPAGCGHCGDPDRPAPAPTAG